jgi:hypothetical protein
MTNQMKRTTLILKDRRLHELKRLAAERGQTLSAVVDEFLADGIRRPRRQSRASASPGLQYGRASDQPGKPR